MAHAPSNHPYAGKHAVILGGGVIGASWAALFLANGLRVTISDPDPDIAAKARAGVAGAAPSLKALGYDISDLDAKLAFERDNAIAVQSADLVQECGPEKAEFKQSLWKAIEAAAPKGALLLSSSSGIPASVQNTQMSEPGRLVIGHPFNPPHLMPLVEVVPSPLTDPSLTERAVAFYRGMGKAALPIRKEVPGFVANRLQAAFLQEAFYLVAEGVVTIDQLDEAVQASLGIRWATSGPFLSSHLGGGPGGLAHFLDHLGPPLEASWAFLGKAHLDEATKALFVEQLNASYGKTPLSVLMEVRDDKEVAVMRGIAEVQSHVSA
jgi:ketoreductase RED1